MQTTPQDHFRRAVAGFLLTLTVVGAAFYTFWPAFPRLVPGVFAWAAGFFLWPDLSRGGRVQVLVLLGIGLTGLSWGVARGVAPDWGWAFSANATLIAMLAAVSFLRLVARPACDEGEQLPAGPRALWQTLLGVHLFGAVINLSVVFIMADRIGRNEVLERRQVMLLTRGFSSAAHWSPFFAAMAAALTFAPGAELKVLTATGVPLAVIALSMSLWDARRLPGEAFRGYPMHYGSLWLPGLLAAAVLGAHFFRPRWPVLGIVTVLAPSVAVLNALTRGRTGGAALRQHLVAGLPRMVNELGLFLAAGVMAAGLGSVFTTFGGWVPFDRFGVLEAGALLVAMVGLSVIGVHPVIGIAAFSTLLVPLEPDPNLLAVTFLAAWSLGVAPSPFSGMNLALRGRYRVSALDIVRWNLGYSLRMCLAVVAALYLYQRA